MLDKSKLNETGVIKRRSIFGTALNVMAIWSLLVTFMNNVALLPYGIVSGIVGIFFFKTNKGPIYKQNELALKIAFYILSAIELIFSATINSSFVWATILIIIFYSAGAPWGKQGYSNQGYSSQEPKVILKKKWWFYLAIVALGFFTMTFSISGYNQMTDTHSKSASQNSSTTDSDSNYVRLDGQKIYYTDSKKYAIGGNPDTSWSAANAKVNSVTVYKIEKGYSYGSKRGRKSTQGMLAINVKIKALKDITVNMDSATVSIPSIDEQHDVETKEDWDDQDKGISKSGTLYVPIYKLNKINNVKSLRLKFDCQQQDNNDSIDADDFDHTYDMTIDLK
ncbi:hypothetical protein KDZ21_08000 [Lactobacillus crispatus]|uniref:hypothetical protein n=1 Tax=Lactobacillus crispatus TaxID=47770 RepID=UPI001C4DDF64|nr:hypothetical protein [Lactobacillus crispatus]MBW0437968.1 hypothetical protein [Lactobacillus crispatus]MBW0444519.1 hypothetical protein [Lactobacillus crispatus]MBW0456190.1 hypothetical protein [Lactobacillus crispatus]